MSELSKLFDQLDAFKLPPIEKWHPEKSVDIDIRIDGNGLWHYQGSLIRRHRISKLFSTVLRLEGDNYYLVTPPVKYRITVDDVPFSAVEMNTLGENENQKLFFRTNMDDVVLADSDHPIEIKVNTRTHGPLPYIEVRDGLKAKIVRSVYYALTDLLVVFPSCPAGQSRYGIYSSNTFFEFGEI